MKRGIVITMLLGLPFAGLHAEEVETTNTVAVLIFHVQETPLPKVFQLKLDDFYVEYKLIVTTSHPERRFPIRSALHQNIQDNFAEAGVEIMSPPYQGNRSGEESTIPDLGTIEA